MLLPGWMCVICRKKVRFEYEISVVKLLINLIFVQKKTIIGLIKTIQNYFSGAVSLIFIDTSGSNSLDGINELKIFI